MPTASSRWSACRRLAAAAALGAAAVAQAQPAPVIQEIEFRGNDVTRPVTMLREMPLRVGDPAEPAKVEASRQAVQDLGLFRWVHADLEPVPGGARLVISVKEKYYILPFPRADANSDGGYGYGVQLTWNNVWGLNHTFYPYFERRQPSEGDADPETRGVQTRAQVRYSAPILYDKFGIETAAGYFDTPYLTPLRYDQTLTFFSLALTRKFSEGRTSQGWRGFTGLVWYNESHDGTQVPTDPDEVAKGHALALSAGVSYRDLRYNVYSDDGMVWGFGTQSATKDIVSDYDFTSWSTYYAQYFEVGDTPHQNLNFKFAAQGRHDGRYGGDSYAIGGTESVRGFEPETVKGDMFYAASVEYLRPVYRNSVRVLAVVDAANAFPEPGDANLDKVYVSAGLGVRLRIQAFVALDLELGVAWPLGGDGDGPRLFASKL